jgi:hypothetical protein
MGYINKQAVNKLIVAQWIYDILEGKYDCLVSDEQYNLLSRLYMCIEGSCLVPYQNYCREFTVNKLPDNRYIRMTEIPVDNSTERILEASDDLRMI